MYFFHQGLSFNKKIHRTSVIYGYKVHNTVYTQLFLCLNLKYIRLAFECDPLLSRIVSFCAFPIIYVYSGRVDFQKWFFIGVAGVVHWQAPFPYLWFETGSAAVQKSVPGERLLVQKANTFKYTFPTTATDLQRQSYRKNISHISNTAHVVSRGDISRSAPRDSRSSVDLLKQNQ